MPRGPKRALYLGEIDGKQITGNVVYYDRNHPSIPRTDTWFGMIQDSNDLKAGAVGVIRVAAFSVSAPAVFMSWDAESDCANDMADVPKTKRNDKTARAQRSITTGFFMHIGFALS
ncbi:MAG: hypothetical protein WA869_28355 [Alloacidobacterium sp.]|jgi:hypothetical protein